MNKLGDDALGFMEENNKKGIILSVDLSLDPEINHGINNVINQQDMVVPHRRFRFE